MKILVVEDDKSASKALPILLKHYGYNTDTTHTVQETLDYLAKTSPTPDYILLDLMLPEKRPTDSNTDFSLDPKRSGLEILRFVQDRNLPATVIIATGMDSTEILMEAEHLKPVAVLRKPIDIKELVRLFNESKHDF